MIANSAHETHKLAMSLTDYAGMAHRYGDIDVEAELLQRAFHYELQAAKMLDDGPDHMWRAVLYRSAASLAMQCGEWDESERLIEVGLSGNPPAAIAHELEELRADVRKKRRKAEREAPKSEAKQPA